MWGKEHKLKMSVYNRAYYQANKEKIKKRSAARQLANPPTPEKSREYKRTYREGNREKIAASNRRYYSCHRAERVAWERMREAKKTQATLPTTDNKLIKNLYEQRIDMTEKRGEEHHVDHIIPLSMGGAHHQDNMRVITAKENMEKHNKYIPELGGVWADNDLARENKNKN